MGVDLRSDNASQPTQAMRRVMCEASVGDDALGEDPTVNALESKVAHLLGKPAAVFMPSGTMCNIVAYEVYCRRSPHRDIIVEASSHPVYTGYCGIEIGRPALRPIQGKRGVLSGGAILRENDALERLGRQAAVISFENTHNRAGGAVWRLEDCQEVAAAARACGAAVHMDGARLPNAAVATGISLREYANFVDSAWVDLSKGLGCPSGAVMAGDVAFVAEARRWKGLLGGGLHKAGLLAAAGIYALDHHWTRLAVDHERARQLADGVRSAGFDLVYDDVPTNIVYVNVDSAGWRASELADELRRECIGVQVISSGVIRAVTHMDIAASDVAATVEVLAAMSRRSRHQKAAHQPACRLPG